MWWCAGVESMVPRAATHPPALALRSRTRLPNRCLGFRVLQRSEKLESVVKALAVWRRPHGSKLTVWFLYSLSQK